MLNAYQRVIFGISATTLGSIVALFEGVAIFYYNDNLGVSLEFLGLANFVIGTLAAYTGTVLYVVVLLLLTVTLSLTLYKYSII